MAEAVTIAYDRNGRAEGVIVSAITPASERVLRDANHPGHQGLVDTDPLRRSIGSNDDRIVLQNDRQDLPAPPRAPVRTERDSETVLVITLDRPQVRNAIDRPTAVLLERTVDDAETAGCGGSNSSADDPRRYRPHRDVERGDLAREVGGDAENANSAMPRDCSTLTTVAVSDLLGGAPILDVDSGLNTSDGVLHCAWYAGDAVPEKVAVQLGVADDFVAFYGSQEGTGVSTYINVDGFDEGRLYGEGLLIAKRNGFARRRQLDHDGRPRLLLGHHCETCQQQCQRR